MRSRIAGFACSFSRSLIQPLLQFSQTTLGLGIHLLAFPYLHHWVASELLIENVSFLGKEIAHPLTPQVFSGERGGAQTKGASGHVTSVAA